MTAAMIDDWRSELGLPELVPTPAACARLAHTCETILGGWSSLL